MKCPNNHNAVKEIRFKSSGKFRWYECSHCTILFKNCHVCGEVVTKDTYVRNHHEWICKDCKNARFRRNNSLNKEARRASNLKWVYRTQYGISVEEFESLLNEQNSKCAICKQECSTGKNLAIDHDHTSGMVRGLLCSRCNRGLGLFSDNPEMLEVAAKYLRKRSGKEK